MEPASFVFILASTLAVGGLALGLRSLAHRRDRAGADALRRARAEGRDAPASLHPVINPSACIGTLSCIKACPEGDIIGMVDGAARLIEASNCIGHGRCALECPMDAIRLVMGDSERGVDLPEVDARFESGRAGVFVVGELGGMGLIQNAITQGLQAGATLAHDLASEGGDDSRDGADVVIVGAGPAGLAAAAALAQQGRSFVVLEQGRFGGAIASYPRQKIAMSARLQIPGFGAFGKKRLSKEELLEGLENVAERFDIRPRTETKVTAIEGEAGRFVVQTDRGPIRTRRVVLATGRRGSPRRLGVPGEDLAKVTYELIDPAQYEGSAVLVVGGGDAAIEAACMLAEATSARVTLSYRKPTFGRCRPANRERVQKLVDSGRIDARLPSEVKSVAEDHVILSAPDGDDSLENDYVIVNIGGELPLQFLEACGVPMKRHHGQEAVSSPAYRARVVGGKLEKTNDEKERAKTRRLNRLLFALGVAVTLALAAMGWEYYTLPKSARSSSPLHGSLRSSGVIGHGIGVFATAFMLLNFLYPLRKRLGFLKGTAPIHRWLSFHVFVGIMSPIGVAFHAAFQSNNTIATSTFLSLMVVVGTGLVGRFVYGLVPAEEGRTIDIGQLRAQLERLKASALDSVRDSRLGGEVANFIDGWARIEGENRPLFALAVGYPARAIAIRRDLGRVRRALPDRDGYRELAATAKTANRLRTQVEFYAGLRRFLSWWRVIHVSLALFLVVIMGAHIGVSLYLGYGWILF